MTRIDNNMPQKPEKTRKFSKNMTIFVKMEQQNENERRKEGAVQIDIRWEKFFHALA
ncbi:MAG: hypothetical protein K6G44_02910 [Lentisphaeria bacterium]|nr:hypothetical protein [Lentisphaeria bacterium]